MRAQADSSSLPNTASARPRLAMLTAAILCSGPLPLQAQEVLEESPQRHAAQHRVATATTLDSVSVTGKRLSEAVEAIGTDHVTATVAITRQALLSAPAGITGLKMLESLPGFNVQANDALGMYEFGNSVSVRAFNFQQIGFLLDGIPMGRSDQFGGSPIYRYVENENLQSVTASSGAGDVSLPSYASLGPIVSYDTVLPAKEFGGSLSQTFGSDNLKRSFARVDFGEHAGLSGYASGSRTESDLWRGPGYIKRDHLEGKLRYAFANGGALTFLTVHNDYYDYDSPSITKAQYQGTAGDAFGRSGRDFAYLGYVPELAESTAGVPWSNALYNQYYKFAVNSRSDHLYGLTLDLPVGDNIDVRSTAYYERKGGYGVSPEAYATSLASHAAEAATYPELVAPRGIQYGLSGIDGIRRGITSKVDWHFGDVHTLSAGFWYEDDDYRRSQRRYNVQDGHPDGAVLYGEVVHHQRDYASARRTRQFFLRDTLGLLDDRLRLDIGFKATSIDYAIEGHRNPADYIAQRTPRLTDGWRDSFLPQVGAVFNLNATDQLFASYSENLALPRGADDIFSAASPAVRGPAAETSSNWELGYRTNRSTLNASAALYYTRFDNRLQSYAAPVPGSTTTETFFQNVGAVDAYGVELSSQWKPEALGGRIYFNGNLSWNVSTFQDDFSTFAIKDNDVPDAPRWVFQGGVTWEAASWALFHLQARTISERYSNLTNTESVGGYTVYSAYADFGEAWDWGLLKDIKLRLNVDNLFDRDYLGTISSTTNTAATFRPGPARTLQVTLSTRF